MTPGTQYAVRITGVGGTIQPCKRNKDGQSYVGGQAYNSSGVAQSFDLNYVVFADNDGTVVPIEAMVKIHAYTALCASITGQIAAIEALRNGAEPMESMAEEFGQRRRFFIKGLREAGLTCFEPKGAFYAFPSIAATGLPSDVFCRRLLEQEKVAIVPGTAFGECGEGYVRCTYANSFDALREALVRLQRFVSTCHG